MNSVVGGGGRVEAVGVLSRFRTELYACLDARADGLFELVEAMLCVDGPVVSLPELSLASVHRRGHGSLYDALASGRLDVAGFTAVLARLEVPRFGGRITPAAGGSAGVGPGARGCRGPL